MIAQLQKEVDDLHSEKQTLEKKFEDSTKEATGNVFKIPLLLLW